MLAWLLACGGDVPLDEPQTCLAPTSTPDSDALVSPESGAQLYRVARLDTDVADEVHVILSYPADTAWSLYDRGRPVSVVVPGAHRADLAHELLIPPWYGMVEVQPIYPGRAFEDGRTAGEFDGGGEASLAVIAEAARFAAGELTADGLTVADLVGTPVCTDRLVLAGTSTGGVTLFAAITAHPDLAELAVGLATHETPSLPQLVASDLGTVIADPDEQVDGDGNGVTWDDARNPGYTAGGCDADGCDVDYGALAWAPDRKLSSFYMDLVDPLPGLLYRDGNENGELDPFTPDELDLDGDGVIGATDDVPHRAMAWPEDTSRGVLSPELQAAAIEQGVLDPDAWPDVLVSPDEAEAFWELRTLLDLLEAGPELDHLAAVLDYTAIDHAIPLVDRPHVLGIYEALLDHGVPTRLNPPGPTVDCFVDRLSWPGELPANTAITHEELDAWALPETIANEHARALGIVGALWEVDGPFDWCYR